MTVKKRDGSVEVREPYSEATLRQIVGRQEWPSQERMFAEHAPRQTRVGPDWQNWDSRARYPSIESAAMAVPSFEPLAVTLDKAGELLDRPLEEIEAAAAQLVQYRHHDGSARWSLQELRIALGEPVKGRRRRSKNGAW